MAILKDLACSNMQGSWLGGFCSPVSALQMGGALAGVTVSHPGKGLGR